MEFRDVNIIVQARFSSSRLPGKVLYPVGLVPALAFLWRRIEGLVGASYWLATSEDPSDDLVACWGASLGIRVFRGSLNDVLSRFSEVDKLNPRDHVVRVTADNILIDQALIRLAIASFKSSNVDYMTHAKTLPVGYGVEVFHRKMLKLASEAIPGSQPYHRTHVTSFFSNLPATIAEFPLPSGWPSRRDLRWTIDESADYEVVARLALEAGEQSSYLDLLNICDRHPNLANRNNKVRQKEIQLG